MARNFFGSVGRGKRQDERERAAREQHQRRLAQQQRQQAMLRGEPDPQIDYDLDAQEPTIDDVVADDDISLPEVDLQDIAPTVIDTARFWQEDDRKREETRNVAFQTQLDDLITALRELRQQREQDQELIKAQEAEISRLRVDLENMQHNTEQSIKAAALNENRTRQQLDDLQTRLDDATRPIRSLQGHVTDLLEQSRRRVDDTNQNKERYAELATTIEHLTAMSDRTSAVSHGLRDNLDSLRNEIDELRRDIIRTDDSIKIVDQESRRRTTAVAEGADGFNGRLDELRSDLSRTFETIEDTRRSMVHIDPTLDELRTADLGLRADLAKLTQALAERYDQLVDMQDESRQETDARFDQLRHTLEERIERLNERLDETNDLLRETTYKISEINAQIEDLRQVDSSLHRDVWYLHEQRVRVRLEQVQEELDLATAQRRDAEGEARVGLGNRVRRNRGAASEADAT